MIQDNISPLQILDFDELNLPVISTPLKLMKGVEFWLKFPQKLKPVIFIFFHVDGLTLWTGAHLHIKCDSHYFMFFPC